MSPVAVPQLVGGGEKKWRHLLSLKVVAAKLFGRKQTTVWRGFDGGEPIIPLPLVAVLSSIPT